MSTAERFRALRWATARRRVLLGVPVLACVAGGAMYWERGRVDPSLVATVSKGALVSHLTTSGSLRPAESITYRSPLAGREAEIVMLVPEGTRVNEGDLLVALDTSELERDVDRARLELRQSETDLQVSEIERREAEATVEGVAEGEGALAVEEARTRLQIAERKAARLRDDYRQLEPLMERGVMTREELRKTGDELERAEEELALARKRAKVVVQVTHPRDAQRAALQLAQKGSQLENARARRLETQARLKLLQELVDNCTLRARRPGLVVYEELFSANPRRKIRVGDRVTGSQGLITIPEVDRMLIEASVSEAEVHRVRPGQRAAIRVEAFPDLRLTGTVQRVGTLARSSLDRPFDEKRFDLILQVDSGAADLRPEMTARADIIVGRKADALLVPVNAVFERQGAFVAYVPGRSGVEMRRVQLGEADDRQVEVVSGLREGDRVLLVEPGAPTTTTPTAAGLVTPTPAHVLRPR